MIRVVRAQRLDPAALQQPPVSRRDLGPERQQPVELLELPDPDRGLYVRPAIVEAKPDVMEPGAALVVAALVAQAPQQLPLLLGRRHYDAALARRDLLVRVEAEDRRHAVATHGPPLVLGAERLGRVQDQSEAVALADGADLVQLARVTEHIHRDDRLRPLGDRCLQDSGVEIQRPRIDVGEDRRGALEDEAVRGGREGQRRGDRFVAGPEPGATREEVQARGAARDRDGVRRPDALGDELLEAVDRRAEREPPGAQHLEHELLLALIQQRASKRDRAQAGAQASAGAGVAYSSHCAQRSLRPRAVSRYASWSSSVIGPTPISTSSTALSGVTSAAVPVMNASSARYRSERISDFSCTV